MEGYSVVRSSPKTMDHVIRMEMAKQEYDANMRRVRAEGIDEGIVIGEERGIAIGEEKERQKAFLEKIESARRCYRGD